MMTRKERAEAKKRLDDAFKKVKAEDRKWKRRIKITKISRVPSYKGSNGIVI
mgnify:CR=1 FL=1